MITFTLRADGYEHGRRVQGGHLRLWDVVLLDVRVEATLQWPPTAADFGVHHAATS